MQCLKQLHSEENYCHITELGKTEPCMLLQKINSVIIGLKKLNYCERKEKTEL